MAKLDEAEIARIVARAGGLGPRERFAYIRSACANDPDAFDRVLLAHNITRDTARTPVRRERGSRSGKSIARARCSAPGGCAAGSAAAA